MTDGASQGLFVIVAVVIFGIFVGISYLLFQDRMVNGLSTIFTDSIEQSTKSLNIKDLKDKMDITGAEEKNGEIKADISDLNDYNIWLLFTVKDNNELEIRGVSDRKDGDFLRDSRKFTSGSLVIPSSVNGKKVTSVYGKENPSSYSLSSAFISATFDGTLYAPSIRDLGVASFYKSKFTGDLSKSLPNLKTIGDYSLMTSVFTEGINSTVYTRIGYYSLKDSKFTGTLDLPNVTFIDQLAFSRSKFTKVNIPKVEFIGKQAFYSSNLVGDLILPNVKTIGEEAFSSSEFGGELQLNSLVGKLDNNTFEKATFTKVTLPDNYDLKNIRHGNGNILEILKNK